MEICGVFYLDIGRKLRGPTYTFLKHLSTENLIEDMIQLHTKLVNLGVVYRNGNIQLVDLEELNDHPP